MAKHRSSASGIERGIGTDGCWYGAGGDVAEVLGEVACGEFEEMFDLEHDVGGWGGSSGDPCTDRALGPPAQRSSEARLGHVACLQRGCERCSEADPTKAGRMIVPQHAHSGRLPGRRAKSPGARTGGTSGSYRPTLIDAAGIILFDMGSHSSRSRPDRSGGPDDFHRRVLDTIGQPVAVTDPAGTLLYSNHAAGTAHGWSVDDVGRNILEIMSLVGEQDSAAIEEHIAAGATWSGEFVLSRDDGTSFPALLTSSVIANGSSQAGHVVVVSTDLTQQSALRRRFQTGFESAPHGWAFADLAGRITEINDRYCDLVGRRREDLLGCTPHEFTLDEDQHRCTPFAEMLAGRAPDTFETRKRYRRDDGTVRWVDVHIELVQDHAGVPEYFFGHAQDITDWVTAQHEAKQAEHAYRELFTQVVFSIGTALELRDPYTASHQHRVAGLAATIGQHLGLDDAVCEGLAVGASLHDMGKLAIPAEILTKPGRLDPAEYALIQRHPRSGHDIVVGIDFPWPVATMILQHHERLDGSGYPAGLQGGEISVEARILAVADTVETIASHRPYRAARPIETALEIIDADRGKLFDPDIAHACIDAFDDGFQLVSPSGT